MSFGDRLGGWLRGAFLDNAAIKFVSLVLAVTIFILVNTGQDVDIGVTVPVRYTMPRDRVLVSERIDQVRLSIRGSWRRTKRFDEREIEPIHIDLTARGDGLLLFQEDMVRLPHGLELLSIAPQSTPLRFEPLVSRSVPIVVRTVGEPAPGNHVAETRPAQETVTIRGAESAVARVDRVQTIEVAVDGRSDSFTTTAQLVAPPDVELVDRLTPVKVTIVPDEFERALDAVPVAVRPVFGTGDLGERFTVTPATVRVTLHGTEPKIEAALAQGVDAYVKVSPDDPAGRPVEVLVRAVGVGHQVDPPTVQLARKR
jgi:YbbR domain-containing protein